MNIDGILQILQKSRFKSVNLLRREHKYVEIRIFNYGFWLFDNYMSYNWLCNLYNNYVYPKQNKSLLFTYMQTYVNMYA